MAARPWVTPQEVRDYSGYKEVKDRTDVQLKTDITKAESYVIRYTKRKFDGVDQEGAPEKLPEDVKTAVILLAEMYAYNAAIRQVRMKSETFDDYSYTVDTSMLDVDSLGINRLLDGYVGTAARGKVLFRMRKL